MCMNGARISIGHIRVVRVRMARTACIAAVAGSTPRRVAAPPLAAMARRATGTTFSASDSLRPRSEVAELSYLPIEQKEKTKQRGATERAAGLARFDNFFGSCQIYVCPESCVRFKIFLGSTFPT